jgi:DNA-binding response OmpR family regulator
MPDKLLVVDDEPKVRALLRAALGKTYDIAEAESGEEALRLARSGEFRLVLLDLMMPGMSGHEVCRRLRRNPLTCHMTVVMLTARDREEDIVGGLQAGADDYLVKPFKISELKARIDSHLRRQWRELQASPLTGLPGNTQIEQVIKAHLTTSSRSTTATVSPRAITCCTLRRVCSRKPSTNLETPISISSAT